MLNKEDQEHYSETEHTEIFTPHRINSKNTHEGKERVSIVVHNEIRDTDFKANYDPAVLEKKSTLVLKTSFHLINYILTGIC